MKKSLSFIIAALVLLTLGAQVFSSVAAADNLSSVDSAITLSQAESGESASPSFEEPANKNLTWLYILIAVAAVVIVLAVIVYISKMR